MSMLIWFMIIPSPVAYIEASGGTVVISEVINKIVD